MIKLMKNILVTGGAGYIGSHTVVELVQAGFHPVVIDNFSNADRSVMANLRKIVNKEISCYEHDFQDSAFLKYIITKESIDAVIHFAAHKSVDESVTDPLLYYRNNVVGLVELVEVLELTGVNNIVLSSSCAVYGEADELPLTEDVPLKPAVSPYGATKQMGETIVRDALGASQRLKGLALRYFNSIGAHPSGKIGEHQADASTVFIPALTQAVAGLRDSLTINGNDYDTPDGTPIRDYTHVVDVAKAHIAALNYVAKQPARFFDVCNLGTGKGSSILEVIQTFEKVTGKKVPYRIGNRRPKDIVASYAAVDKAHRMLSWQAQYTLADGLRDAWRWQQNLLKN
jgi:UDP-glucose 4-epimerase